MPGWLESAVRFSIHRQTILDRVIHMFNKQVVQHNHLALAFTRGKLTKILDTGSHRLLGADEVAVHSRAEFPANLTNVDRLIVEYKDLLSPFVDVIQTSSAEVALVQKGTQFFWSNPRKASHFGKTFDRFRSCRYLCLKTCCCPTFGWINSPLRQPQLQSKLLPLPQAKLDGSSATVNC